MRRPALLPAMLLAGALALAGCATVEPPSPEASFERADAVSVVERDPQLFTQGLEFGPDGSLFHSGGRYGESRVVRATPEGDVLAEFALPEDEFAEGLTLVGDELYVLTWREHVVRVLRADDLSQVRTLELETEGWGACYEQGSDVVWVSDGTSTVRGYSPEGFAEVEAIEVTGPDGAAVESINELECIGGEIWANLWQAEALIVIDPTTGDVERTIALEGISADADDRDRVLNGIAHDPDADTIWVTGKLWGEFFVFDYELLRGGRP